MQPVGQKQLGPGLAFGVEHGAEDVDVADILQCFGVAGNQRVGLPDSGQQGQARGAGLDGDVVDPRARQLGAHALHEAGKAGQHVGGRAALGQVVVARVEQHLPGLVLGHQLARQRAAVGQRRAAKAALQHQRLGAEILRQMRPQANRRAADKQHATARRALRLVGAGESGQAALPARMRRRNRRRFDYWSEFWQLLRLKRWRSGGQQRRQRQQGRQAAGEGCAGKGFEGGHPGKFIIGRFWRLLAGGRPVRFGVNGCRLSLMLQFY